MISPEPAAAAFLIKTLREFFIGFYLISLLKIAFVKTFLCLLFPNTVYPADWRKEQTLTRRLFMPYWMKPCSVLLVMWQMANRFRFRLPLSATTIKYLSLIHISEPTRRTPISYA